MHVGEEFLIASCSGEWGHSRRTTASSNQFERDLTSPGWIGELCNSRIPYQSFATGRIELVRQAVSIPLGKRNSVALLALVDEDVATALWVSLLTRTTISYLFFCVALITIPTELLAKE